jgi:phosphoadenosine phosphosulfate reductase
MIADAALRNAVAALDRLLAHATPAEIISEAVRAVPKGRLAVVSSFGTESAALLKFVADVDRSLPVIFLDTGWLFEETLAYRDTLVAQFGLTDVRVFAPSPTALARQDPQRELWLSDPDLCCRLRKVVPLAEALQPFDAWINGRKRFHGQERAQLSIVEPDGARLKFNPLATTPKGALDELYRTLDLPRHPLTASGFASVGCMPCTSRTRPGESVRAGRWRGLGKTECGIHVQVDVQEVAPEAAPNLGRHRPV